MPSSICLMTQTLREALPSSFLIIAASSGACRGKGEKAKSMSSGRLPGVVSGVGRRARCRRRSVDRVRRVAVGIAMRRTGVLAWCRDGRGLSEVTIGNEGLSINAGVQRGEKRRVSPISAIIRVEISSTEKRVVSMKGMCIWR